MPELPKSIVRRLWPEREPPSLKFLRNSRGEVVGAYREPGDFQPVKLLVSSVEFHECPIQHTEVIRRLMTIVVAKWRVPVGKPSWSMFDYWIEFEFVPMADIAAGP